MDEPTKPKSFYMDLEELGPEHSVAFLIEEFFNRHLFPNKDDVHKFATSDLKIKNLYVYAENVHRYLLSNAEKEFNEYVTKIVSILKGDVTSESDTSTAAALLISTLADHHLIRWFKEI